MLVALRLLHYLGFRTVYLIGADFKMTPEQGHAFDEARSAESVRHNNVLYDSLNRRFEALRDHFPFSKLGAPLHGSELHTRERAHRV